MARSKIQLKLIHKLFLANVFVILSLTAILTSISYVSFKNMSGIINEKIQHEELNMMEDLLPALEFHYFRFGHWDQFASDPKKWHHFVREHTGANHKPPKRHRGPSGSLPSTGKTSPDIKEKQEFAPGSPEALLARLGPPHHVKRREFVTRISLFDTSETLLIGESKTERSIYQAEIKVEGKLVGFVKLAESRLLEKEGNRILRIQLERILMMTLIGLIISLIVSFFLARHFTSPIKQIHKGFSRLSQREFSTRVDINSNDELAQLGQYFNSVAQALSDYESQQKQWLQDIAHELRTPLTVIRGEVEAMIDGVTPLTSESLELLQQDILRLNHLIADLHDLSVTTNIDFAKDSQPVQLDSVLESTVRRFRPILAKKGISVLTEISPSLVKGTSSRLEQVFTNLLENCFKYSDEKSVVWVTMQQEGEQIVCKVEDSGPGVAADKLPLLFDRLYRVQADRNRKTGGAGLGLAICKNIIVAHSGTIEALQSSKGGLKIYITLPAEKIDD